MEKFYVVISQVSDGGLQMDGQDYANEAEARGTAKQDCQRSGECHFVAEVIAAFERPEPQIVEHNLSGRRRRKVAPAIEKKPAEKKRKAKEAPKEEVPAG